MFFVLFFVFVVVAVVVFVVVGLFCFVSLICWWTGWKTSSYLLNYTNMPLSSINTSPSDSIVLYCNFLRCILCFINSLIRVQCDL